MRQMSPQPDRESSGAVALAYSGALADAQYMYVRIPVECEYGKVYRTLLWDVPWNGMCEYPVDRLDQAIMRAYNLQRV